MALTSIHLRLATLLLCGLVAPRPAFALVVPRAEEADERLFPRPAIVRKQVRFWEKVFGKYPSTTVIIHESTEPDHIIDLIDYKLFAKREDKDTPVARQDREKVTSKYLKRYSRAVERFKKFGDDALKFGAIEKRLYAVFKNDPKALARLYAGQIKLRAQTGLADDFKYAANVAQAYLPYMEKVFAAHGVPTKLSRLPFVESMFNLKARSKVGASGIWQFMPSTARLFIHVNNLVDERNSPFKATRAAAQFLSTNYRDLRAWPLAITAYNHGKLGMEKAARQVGTADIGEIILRFQSPSFGFASRNFYAEFLAAVETYDKVLRSGSLSAASAPVESVTEPIVIDHPLTVTQLLAHTPLTKEVLSEHNPCLLDTALTRYANKLLPQFYEIRVPKGLAQATKAALLALKEKKYARK